MATQPIETVSTDAQHFYHADAYVLSAELQEPVAADIKQTVVTLPKDGKYTFKQAEPYQLFGVLSYSSGYAQVTGHDDPHHNGFRTLTTAAIENLNVLDVVTADRVVGQISTVHHYEAPVPSVTFLGTRFVNLRIGGHKVDIDQDLHILGSQPAGNISYLDAPDVLARMARQYSKIREAENLPDWAAEQFRWDRASAGLPGQASCSLVNRIDGAPGVCFGHVIDLPHFGKIFLGELCVERNPAPDPSQDETYHFRLTMIRLEMGCIGTGKVHVVALDSNGKGGKGGGG
jgi:hypothetical protein